MRKLHILAIGFVLFVTACNRAPQNKDAVKQAVIEHLGKGSGLDPNAMTIEVTSVDFKDKEAAATVTFRPKSNPEQAMSMSYSLEAKGNKWVVVKKAGPGGADNPHGGPVSPLGEAPGGAAMPPGHPPVKPDKAGSKP